MENSQVSFVKTEYAHLCDNEYKMCVHRSGRLTILKKETERKAKPVSTPKTSLNEQQSSPSVDTPVIKKETIRKIRKKRDKLANKMRNTLHVPKLTISEITGNQKVCSCVDLRVKSIVTAEIVIGPNANRYMTFIGSDDSGEIACTIFEPHCLVIGRDIQVIFFIIFSDSYPMLGNVGS